MTIPGSSWLHSTWPRLVFAGCCFFGKKSSKAVLIVLISFGLAGATMLAGCSSTHDTTTAGNYTVTVTGTNLGSTASTTFTLTVKP